jgi:hypothetical protein
MAAADVQGREGAEAGKPAPPGHLVVQVYNEDIGGPPFTVDGGPGEKVSKIVEAVYGRLGLDQKPTDRLLCHATGEDVRQYGDMHLRDYAVGRCSALVWTFARDHGGARA